MPFYFLDDKDKHLGWKQLNENELIEMQKSNCLLFITWMNENLLDDWGRYKFAMKIKSIIPFNTFDKSWICLLTNPPIKVIRFEYCWLSLYNSETWKQSSIELNVNICISSLVFNSTSIKATTHSLWRIQSCIPSWLSIIAICLMLSCFRMYFSKNEGISE